MKNFIINLIKPEKKKSPNSNFSRFFREGTPEEKQKVFMKVIKSATEDQLKILNTKV